MTFPWLSETEEAARASERAELAPTILPMGGAGLCPAGAHEPVQLHRGVKEGVHGGTLGSPVLSA